MTKKVGRRIAELRMAKGMTQGELAEKLAASVPWVSRVEGRENLTFHTLVKIARALGARTEPLFEEPGPGAPKVRRGRPRKAQP